MSNDMLTERKERWARKQAGRETWKGSKFVRTIEFLAEDKLGFWEVRGYRSTADPWTDDRFA